MTVAYEPKLGRIPIRDLTPQIPENRWPSKAFRGEVVQFGATVFREGHDQLGVHLIVTDPFGAWTTHRMRPGAAGTDRWHADVALTTEGEWSWRVRAFADEWATWLHNAEIKIPARVDVDLMITIGAQLLGRVRNRKIVQDALTAFADPKVTPEAKLAIALDPQLTLAIDAKPLASLTTDSETLTIRVERERAGVGNWYEFFPRSEGAKQAKDGTWTSGTFRTAAKRIPAVAAMGFDVLYLPPIHPIGEAFRKGRNNTLDPAPGDPGSPWAIGGPAGGHDAVHPDLGDLKDFAYFVGVARRNGMEVALDLALQASPDHPWVTEHPEWFTTLPDGSIAYAENPPKKYQDIYPINFDNDPEGIREEVLRIMRHWIAQGVRIFRVDNPHTKPLQFWEMVLHEINTEHPDVVFLAEAFTRPAMMQSLAQVGFQQSYSYFTWRNTKLELAEFFESISHETSGWFRPNLFVNTPDILTEYLQFGGPAAYKIRAALAATASPLWGVYAGYELFEHVARPGSEENIDNEKYEYKQRDWAAHEKAGTSLAPFLQRLNLIRAAHPALRQLRNLDVHWSDDDSILVYTKYLAAEHASLPTGTAVKPLRGSSEPAGVGPGSAQAASTGSVQAASTSSVQAASTSSVQAASTSSVQAASASDALIIVANVDPHSVRETIVHLDLTRIGLAPDARFTVTDLITGAEFEWGRDNYVRLDAFGEPVHILHVHTDPAPKPKGR